MDDQGTQKSFSAGETIMSQGEAGNSAYIIESGRVEILIEAADGTKQSVGTRGAGSIIGEMALVDGAPRTATVRALELCEMLEITHEDFERRLKVADPVVSMIMRVILTRYRDTLARARITSTTAGSDPAESREKALAGELDAVESLKLENDLRQALKNNELVLYYQPIIHLASAKIAGFEALMRWDHPVRGRVSPAIFIPVAEESNLIVEFSKWALTESCQALRRIEERAGIDGQMYVSVNFTGRDFSAESFTDDICAIIRDAGVETRQILLEITERLLMQQPENANKTLNACRDMGINIAIDDFGTGYSSLSYLHYFPITTLKIDKSFVQNVTSEGPSFELIRSIIALGQNLNMEIIAEGVEALDEAKKLNALGCEKAQGYYFAKPMPEDELMAFVENWSPPDLSE